MGVNAVVYVQGSDLTDADVAHLSARCEEWATEPAHVDASQHTADGQTILRICLRTGMRYAAADGSRGCWPQVADTIAAMQAAFPGRDVYYTSDAVDLDQPRVPSDLVTEQLLAEHLADWGARGDVVYPYDEDCRHAQLKFEVENISPLFHISGLVRPAWWFASVNVECISCGAWAWNTAATDDDLTPPAEALTGPRARIALTELLEGRCRTLRDAFAVAWSATV